MRRDIFIHNIQSHRKSYPASSGSVDSPREPFRVRADSPGGSLVVQSKNEGVCRQGVANNVQGLRVATHPMSPMRSSI
jgi:hypothetical protein